MTDNQCEGCWAGIYPAGVVCIWACRRSKSPWAWSLALIVTDNQSEGRWGGINPARVVCKWAWQRSKSPWSLALIVTDNQSEGCWAGIYPVGVMRFWACQRMKKPLQLSSHRDRQPVWGVLGWNLPRRGGVYLGLSTLEKPLAWSLALIVTDNQSEGRWGGINPARVVCKWAWQRSKSPCELRHLSLQNLSPQKYTFGEIATPRQNGSSYRAHLQDRGRIRNSPRDGVPSPARPGTSKRVVLMAKARTGYLVVFFGRNSPRVWAKTVGSERVSPRRTRLSPKDPGASSPPLVNPRQIPPGSAGLGWIYPARVMCIWAWQRSKRPWSLALILTDNQSEGCCAGIYPVGVMRFWACQRMKKPLQLSSHRDRQPEWGASGWTLPRQSHVSLGLATLEKTLELSSHCDRQPEWGVLGWNLPRRGDAFLGLATLEKPPGLELSSHRDRQPERGVLCWNLPRRGDAFLGLSTHEKAPAA